MSFPTPYSLRQNASAPEIAYADGRPFWSTRRHITLLTARSVICAVTKLSSKPAILERQLPSGAGATLSLYTATLFMADSPRVRITHTQLLSNGWQQLESVSFDYRRSDGDLQTQTREIYRLDDGAAVLLYNLAQRTVVLIRQFRLARHLRGGDGHMIEVPAGFLDAAHPEARIMAEIEEETGYHIRSVRQLFSAAMMPGTVASTLHFFAAEYDPSDRKTAGGGLHGEGEDIEVLELPFDTAERMIVDSQIVDGKTIMLLQYARLTLFTAQDHK